MTKPTEVRFAPACLAAMRKELASLGILVPLASTVSDNQLAGRLVAAVLSVQADWWRKELSVDGAARAFGLEHIAHQLREDPDHA